jgi:sugar phosphate isomerase/epimerase
VGDPSVGVEAASGGLDAVEVAQEVVQQRRLPLRPDQDRVGAALDGFESGDFKHDFQSGVILSGTCLEFNAAHPYNPGRMNMEVSVAERKADVEAWLRQPGQGETIKRALEVAEQIPCTFAIQHIGVGNEEFDDRKLEAAFSSMEELNLFARSRGVEVLLENIPNQLSSAERLNYFLGITHLDNGYCFDTGHAHIHLGVEHEFELMKGRIRSTHIHDNDGTNDIHLFPFLAEGGSIDWKRTMKLLRSRPGQYPMMLELREAPGMDPLLDKATDVRERLADLGHEE